MTRSVNMAIAEIDRTLQARAGDLRRTPDRPMSRKPSLLRHRVEGAAGGSLPATEFVTLPESWRPLATLRGGSDRLWPSGRSLQGELAVVMVVVRGAVMVDVEHGHGGPEVGVPSGREVHRQLELGRGFGGQSPGERVDGGVHDPDHPPRWEHEPAAGRSGVVDHVEGAAECVEGGREAATPAEPA